MMNTNKLSAVLAVGALAMATGVLVSAQEPPAESTFYACVKDGKLIPGSMQVDEAPDCNGGAELFSWNEQGPQGEQGEQGPITDLTVDGRVLTPTIAGTNLITVAAGSGCVGYGSTNTSVFGSLTMPVGATLTGFTATWYDAANADVQVGLWKRSLAIGGGNLQGVAGVSSSGNGGLGSTTSPAIAEVVDSGEQFLVSFIFPTVTEAANLGGLCGVELHLS